MKRIGILELISSNHGLPDLCEICGGGRYSVTVFTTAELYTQIFADLSPEALKYRWVKKQPSEDLTAYLKRAEDICNSEIDLLIVNTVADPKFQDFNPKCRKLLTVYEFNAYFRADWELTKYLLKKLPHISFYILHKIFKSNNRLTWFLLRKIPEKLSIDYDYSLGLCIKTAKATKKILELYDGVIVEYSGLKKYAQSTFKYSKNIHVLPHWYYTPAKTTISSGRVRFIVPGMVDSIRRDYETILWVLENLDPNLIRSYMMTFAGKPIGAYGEMILSRCDELKLKGHDIKYYKDRIKSIDDVIRDSDVILSPLALDFNSYYSREKYTLSKGTGVVGDCIRNGKPLIAPIGFEIGEELEGAVKLYRDKKELKSIIEKLITDKKELETLKKKALNTCRKTTLEKTRKIFDEIVNTEIRS